MSKCHRGVSKSKSRLNFGPLGLERGALARGDCSKGKKKWLARNKDEMLETEEDGKQEKRTKWWPETTASNWIATTAGRRMNSGGREAAGTKNMSP